MPDQPQPNQTDQPQNQGFLGKYLPYVLSALGGAALSAAAPLSTKGAQSSAGIFLNPEQFNRAMWEKPQAMHPATWMNLPGATKRKLGSRTSSRATGYQADIDKEMMGSPGLPSGLTPETMFSQTGWTESPVLGKAREIPDIGSRLTEFGNQAVLEHPSVNLHQLFNIPPINLTKEVRPSEGTFWYDETYRGKIQPYIDLSLSPSVIDALHEFTHAGQYNARALAPVGHYPDLPVSYRNPQKWTPEDLNAVAYINPGNFPGGPNQVWSTLLKAQAKNKTDLLDSLRGDLSYIKKTPEYDPVNVEMRYQDPFLYYRDPTQTALFPKEQLIYPRSRGPWHN